MTREEQKAITRIKAEKMAAMYRQGLTLEDIGRQFDCTREYVRQLVRRLGVDACDGGQAVRSKSLKASKVSKARLAQSRQEAKYGVHYELLCELRACGATGAYQRHRRNSSMRGIAFKLGLAEWWAIWQTSGKFHLRGRGTGHYCMSRIKDTGGYELGNVHVQLIEENSREAVAKWDKAKPIPGVFCLYPGRDKAWLAAYGKTRLGYYATAEEAGAARAAYMLANGKKHGAAGLLGSGKGWTIAKKCKVRPYLVQVKGTKSTYHSTQAEAEAEYARRCAEVVAQRETAKA